MSTERNRNGITQPLRLLLSTVALLALPLAHAEGPVDIAEILRPVEEMRIKADIPGLTVATFTGQGLQFTYASGRTSNAPSSEFVSAQKTLFPIASVSKLFTAVSIFQLLQKEKFTLDTSLSELELTSFHRLVKDRCPTRMLMLEKIKVRHLLSHQGGINQDTPGANLWWDVSAIEDGMYPSERDYNDGFCSLDQLLEPGTAPLYKYSNTGFNLLAEIVAAYGDEPSFESYVQKNILRPLDMKNTFYSLDSQRAEDQLVTSHGNPGTNPNLGPKGRLTLPKVLHPLSYEGSIGVNSTAEDLAKFGQMLLGWTSGQSSKDASETIASLSELWETILNPVSKNSTTASIGNGFMVFDTKLATSTFHAQGFICYGHTGTGYGSRSILYVCPELDWGFVALFNTRDVNREEYLRVVSELLAKKGLIHPRPVEDPKVQEWLKRARAFHAATEVIPLPRPAKLDEKDIPEELRPFVGIYSSGVVGDIEVSVSVNKKLMVRNVELDQEGPDSFRYPINAGSSDVREPVKFVRACPGGPVVQIIQAHVLFAPRKSPAPLEVSCQGQL